MSSASLHRHVTHRLIYFPPLMFGLCSSRLWSIPYQLYMTEFPHSDVLKIIQTFLCLNWNINISTTGCLLKGWKLEVALRSCSVALSHCWTENRIPLSASPFSWFPHLYLILIIRSVGLIHCCFCPSLTLSLWFFFTSISSFPGGENLVAVRETTSPDLFIMLPVWGSFKPVCVSLLPFFWQRTSLTLNIPSKSGQ